MHDKIAQEVQEALTKSSEEIALEQLQDEDSSPLNQPVIEKDIGGERPEKISSDTTSWNVWKPELGNKVIDEQVDFRSAVEKNIAHEKAQEPLDAPEQEIEGSAINHSEDSDVKEHPEVPLAQANQAADALLGMTNNVMAIGGGYFVKINKHQEFYEFEEILQLIETQNEKNVDRIKLDKEDQALLRPLLAQVLRKKSKQLTPEQQLMGAIISILMKKAQIVMEVRAENGLLEERILDIVRDEKGYSKQDEIENDSEEVVSTNSINKEVEKPKPDTVIKDIETEEIVVEPTILEVAEVSETEK